MKIEKIDTPDFNGVILDSDNYEGKIKHIEIPKLEVNKEMISSQRKKEVLASVLAVMINTMFETHPYDCEGDMYLQDDGHPTELRPSGQISCIVMNFWIIEIKAK